MHAFKFGNQETAFFFVISANALEAVKYIVQT